ncbi:MAG TPA: PLP-dependent aspartate aminotransferase family protein, partial [Candidatus Binatus sp.]|nr:PLP-dependent aspartate aminotransferase family protein [Candidatus Binatus sp.]
MSRRPPGFQTRAIRAAARMPEVRQRPTAVPIYQTATFSAEDAEQLGDVVADGWAGYSYSRLSNPTTRALGDAFAEVAGGEAGYALASGMAAIHAALAATLRAGDRVVASRSLYGSTRAILGGYFARFGVTAAFVDITDHGAVAAALAAAPTAVLYAETSANPTTFLADHAALASLAHRHGARYLVDNTFASSYVCRPLELGADLVIESATKYLGGHSDLIAGGVTGSAADIRKIVQTRGAIGTQLDPNSCWMLLRSLETLQIRAERASTNARRLAEFLRQHDKIAKVDYLGFLADDDPRKKVFERQSTSPCSTFSFDVKGGEREAFAFLDKLSVCKLAVSLGGTETLI